MNIKGDNKIIEITRENYKNHEWNEYSLFQYRGLKFKCDHEYDAGVYNIWLSLPVGPKYIRRNQVGDLPYVHQYGAGYIEGNNAGPYFHSAVEELMDYVDEFYEYLSPYINKKNNDSNEDKSFTDRLVELQKKVDDLQVENQSKKNNVNEAKYDGTPYAKEFHKIYEDATQEEKKDMDKILEVLEEKLGIDDEKNNISSENRFVYQPGDLRVSSTQCQLCKFYNLNNKDICRAYPDGKPEKVVNKQVMCKHFEHESDRDVPKNT